MTLSRILIDCDGPLADWTGAICAALTRRGFERTPEEIRHWDVSLSLSHDEAAEMDTIMRVPGFWSALPRMSYADELVRMLRRADAEVFCVTSPYPTSRFIVERSAWLSDLFPADDVLYVRSMRKAMVRGDVLIEDHPGIAAAWCDANPSGHAILVDRPWNRPGAREFWPHPRVIRTPDAYLFDMLPRFL